MTPSLLVMAAGVGSRFGGLKQLVPVGPAGEVLMDYAVYDALRAGIERLVFVIRREMEADFHQRLGRRYAGRAEVVYAYQELDDLPAGFAVPVGRSKPWGTGHAVLAARRLITGPFVVINADDFYGAEGFAKLAAHFSAAPAPGPERYAMVAYQLAQTLSEHGTVARGVCRAAGGLLAQVEEHTGITRTPAGIVGRGPQGEEVPFAGDEPVSLNFWGFTPGLFAALGEAFEHFLATRRDEAGAELYLPAVVDAMIHDGRAEVALLATSSPWFGVTYREDQPRVATAIAQRVAAGEYPRPLWPGP